MQKNSAGESATTDVMGCRFHLAVLSDNFVPMLLDAIGNVNTEKIWNVTEKLSTVYRGRRVHVLDCVKACFSNIVDNKTFIILSTKFSKEGDKDIEKDCFIASDDIVMNNPQKDFNVIGRVAFYPMGVSNHVQHIDTVINMAKERGIHTRTSYYADFFEGSVHDIFDFINEALIYAEKNTPNFVLDLSILAAGEPKEGMVNYEN